MKAVICTKYGDPEVLQIREIKKPTPKNNEVLIKNYFTTVHIGDTKIRRLEPGMGALKDVFYKPMMRLMIGIFGPRKKILGMEFSGVIEALGSDVKNYKVGDAVFGSTEMKFGTYSEYHCVKENSVMTTLPNNMGHDGAAPLSNGSLTALYYLRKAKIKAGQKVLIYGASGSVGTYAVQIAKYHGAIVTGVCSTTNQEMAKSLGADHIIDYKNEDFTTNGESYDIIFDTVGKIPKEKRKISLSKLGMYVNVLDGYFKLKMENLLFIKTMVEEGKLKSIIDRTYPLEKIVEAHRYVDAGHKKGNVLVGVLNSYKKTKE